MQAGKKQIYYWYQCVKSFIRIRILVLSLSAMTFKWFFHFYYVVKMDDFLEKSMDQFLQPVAKTQIQCHYKLKVLPFLASTFFTHSHMLSITKPKQKYFTYQMHLRHRISRACELRCMCVFFCHLQAKITCVLIYLHLI